MPERNGFCVSPEQQQHIERTLTESRKRLLALGILKETDPNERVITSLSWPVDQHNGLDDYGIHSISNFFDHQPDFPNQTLDYHCGNRTYDLPSGYNHRGTDIFLWPFAWYKMEHDQAKVIAAAPGVILYKNDGQFDQSCTFNANQWNAVYIQHADGSVAWYGHLKDGSLTTKSIGENVERGEYLGIVGSSGSSTGPHLHFEMRNAGGFAFDPYAGECNNGIAQSWWMAQRPYFDSQINALRTQSAPTISPACPQVETPNEQQQFCAQQTIYFTSYFRDQLPGQTVRFKIYRPDNIVWQQWDHTFTEFYSASWWWWSYILPANAATGAWRFEAEYEGAFYERVFDANIQTTIWAEGNTSFCPGEYVTLHAPVSAYGFSYQWRKNGENISGQTEPVLEATQSGLYSCAVTTEDGCTTTSNGVLITVHPLPDVAIEPSGEIYSCPDDFVTLMAPPGGLQYLWSIGAGTESITVFPPGEHIVTITSSEGCTAVSDTVFLFLLPVPMVDLGPDSLYSEEPFILDAGNPGAYFEWSTGETGQTLLVAETGWHGVTVTNADGCIAMDSIYVEVLVSHTDPDGEDHLLQCSPNPTQDKITVYAGEGYTGWGYVVFDIYGRAVMKGISESSATTLDMEHLPVGVYVLEVKGEGMGRQVVKVLKI